MNEDQQTYQRAKSSSLLGLGIQFLMAASLLFLALWSGQWALHAGFYHALGGVGIWVCLWLVYQQHRLERLEAMEAEQLAARHGEDSSIFEVSADDLSVARRRLRWLYKWALPGSSMATALYLLVTGALLLNMTGARLEEQAVPEQVLVLFWVCAGGALVAFLTSRYLAGMAKIPQWQLLRGGATYLMGNVVVVALLAGAMLGVHFDVYGPLRYMVVVVPVLMIVVGLEMALNLLLNFYRPRAKGEVPRPAFESRLLGLLTTPESIAKTINETINYQFGFEVTRSWFWQLLSRVFVALVVFGVGVMVLLSTVVVVGPEQRAMVMRLGALEKEPLDPGIHLKLPWPISRVSYYDVTTVRTIVLGAEPRTDIPILWSNPHAEEGDHTFIVAPPRDRYTDPNRAEEREGDRELQEVTRKAPDVFLVSAEALVHYRLDPEKLYDYMMSSTDAGTQMVDARLHFLAEREFSRYLLRYDIDEWIGTGRIDAGEQIRERLQARADAESLGVEVLDVLIPSVHPPRDVADAFHRVINAGQQVETNIQRAQQEAIQVLATVAGTPGLANRIVEEIETHERLRQEGASEEALLEQELLVEQLMQRAGGQAAVLIAEARGNRWEREVAAHGDAVRFPGQLLAYEKAPRVYQARSYLSMLREGLLDARKYVIVGDRQYLTIRGDLKELDSGFDAALDLMEEQTEASRY